MSETNRHCLNFVDEPGFTVKDCENTGTEPKCDLCAARDLTALRSELAVANERVQQVQADYQYFVEKGESRERAGEATWRKNARILVDRLLDYSTKAADVDVAEYTELRRRAGEFCWLCVDPDVSPLSAPSGSIPPAGAERASHFECDHCGDVAIERKDGMFTDGDGGECASCGMPGQVSMDAETAPYWNTSQEEGDRCNRKDCEDCADIPLVREPSAPVPPLCGSSRPSRPSQVCDDKAGHIGGHSSQKHETWWPSDGSAPPSRYAVGLCPEHAVAMEVCPGSRTLTVEEIVAVRALIQERAAWPVGTGDVGVPKADDTVRASLACRAAVKGGGKP